MPPFFFPIAACVVWFLALFSYLPVLQLELRLAEQIVAPLLFVSYLLVVLAWPFSGAVAASVLTCLFGLAGFYLALCLRDPELFLQPVIYGILLACAAFSFQRLQKEISDRTIEREKRLEELHAVEEAIVKDGNLKEALRQKIDRFVGLEQFSEELKGIQDLDRASGRIVEEVHRVLAKADEAVLCLVDPDREDLYLAAWKVSGGVLKSRDPSVFDRWVMRRSQAILVEDSENDFRFFTGVKPVDPFLRSLCASPLTTENRVLGVLRASSSRKGCFQADDLRLLDAFSGLGAVMLRNILLCRRLQELAVRDSLTQLHVNRYFQDRLSEEVKRACWDGGLFSLILLDIDFFKRYNDEYGHAAGDLVLKNIAAVLLKCLGPADLAARYGGEEFSILLPNQGKKEALLAAERVRSEIKKNVFTLRRVEARVTASLGAASFPQDGKTKEELLWAADRNLYEAKRLGRDRVAG
ncbi:MAG: sensor domain-containing diguanylate cyclase [Candidatus Omnitrophica bacterium]|nr:sensor domain-containing diguanylate cyclase [Candidatus Omnitrophota bacterium]